tara:strand:+ start:100 stop:348 length:249 start_codon:yes stop_codon:yes gene_type:complete
MVDCYQKSKLEGYEIAVYENAVYFTASCFLGVGKYERHEFDTEHDAVNYAAANPRCRPWGIYAVDANKHDTVCGLVRNAKYV